MVTKDNIFDVVAPWINHIAADEDGEVWGWNTEGLELVSLSTYLNISPWWTDCKESLISRHVDEFQWIGKWCFMWDDAICQTLLRVLGGIVDNHPHGYRYSDSMGIFWRNARPATKEELLSRCFDPSE